MSRLLFILAGALSALAGLYALFNPFPATLVASALAGWVFVLYGVLQILASVQASDWGGRLWSVLIGVLALLLGIWVLANPLANIIALTVMIAVLFLVSGVAKLVAGYVLRQSSLFWPVLISGAASVLLGGLILRHFPDSAAWTLGYLLGIELLSNGIATLAFAWVTRTRA